MVEELDSKIVVQALLACVVWIGPIERPVGVVKGEGLCSAVFWLSNSGHVPVHLNDAFCLLRNLYSLESDTHKDWEAMEGEVFVSHLSHKRAEGLGPRGVSAVRMRWPLYLKQDTKAGDGL